MKTELPDPRQTPRFAGLVTFGRYPRLVDVAPAARPLDWIIYGVPHDGGVTYRPGARFGPRAIRDESQYLKPYSIHHALNICEAFSIADAGDAPVKPYAERATLDSAAAFAAALPDPAAARLLALGGDHTVAYANLRATWERRGRPSGGFPLVHFDSHLDTVDAVWDERFGHASVFIRAIEDGLVDPSRMISLGIKGPLNSGRDLDFARAKSVTILGRDDAVTSGPAALAAFVNRLAGAPAYVTFDIDCVDPAFAPGTGTPSIGGFTSAEALALVRACRGLNVVGADVVEVLPDRDPGGITALLAAHVAFEIMCLAATRP